MAGKLRVQAAAKVNLHLRVYDRRVDGFHEILSLFQAVSLADSIVMRSLKESDTIEIEGDFDCQPRATTLYKAAQAFRALTGERTGLAMAVTKRIPAGAGLGGGSSDAAAVLLGLDALFGTRLDSEALAGLGAGIGSDVPFFLSSSAALVSGRGERVRGIEARDDFSITLAFPGFPVSTAAAYAELDRERPDASKEADPGPEELLAAYRGSIGDWPFANSFEPVIGAARPRIPAAKAALEGAGALFAAMSGSGSAVFGVFEPGRESAALDRLRAEGYEAHALSPLARCTTLD